MQLVRDPFACPTELKNAVIVLGNFDGVHKGHQAVIEHAKNIAAQLRVPCAVLTFEPHPIQILKPNTPPIRITPLRLKAERIKALGVDGLITLHFTKALSQLSGEAFIEDILVNALNASHIVSGYDFMFGYKRSGNPQLLQQLGPKHGYGYTQIAPVGEGSIRYSSTSIREALKQGDVEQAAHLLGHGYHLLGRVSKGEQLAQTLGFPTANIKPKKMLLPKFGVYAALATCEDGTQHNAVINIGVKPTFGKKIPLIEAHLLSFSGDLYGQWLRLDVKAHIRNERTFDGIEALKLQIKRDCEAALTALKN